VFASKGSTAPLHCCTCAFTKLHCMPVTCQECCDMRSCHQLCHLCVVAMGLFVHSLQDVNDLASCCIGCCQSCTHWCSIDVTWFNSPEFAMLLLSSIRLRQLGRSYGVLDHKMTGNHIIIAIIHVMKYHKRFEKPYISCDTLSKFTRLLGDRPANGCQELKIIV
jgi:hypothetical protein